MQILLLIIGVTVLDLDGRTVEANDSEKQQIFERSFASVVIRNCLECHNSTLTEGGLDLSHRETTVKGGESGAAVVANKPTESILLERIREGSMPPEGKGKRLTPKQIAAIQSWIEQGAHWPDNRILSPYEFSTDYRAGLDWWSLQPISRPAPPQVKQQDQIRNPIDAFILKKLEAKQFRLASEVDRTTFIRRAKFDLLGLPPTIDEIDAFVSDSDPLAYEKLIDNFLKSPHYGERWARHWLDTVRFGESDGFENDKLRPHSWRYRDYVINSFNSDKPYSQFIREQLAGDALTPFNPEALIATGFLVAGPWDEVQSVGKSQSERLRTQEEQREELLGAIGQTFLGLTLHCARCHDHKFDPIPQVDYYRVKSVFEGIDHAEGRKPGNLTIFTPKEKQQYEIKVAPIRKRIVDLKKQRDDSKNQESTDASFTQTNLKTLMVAGKFGSALDARVGEATVSAKPIYHTPPLTVECWAKVDSRSKFNILVAANEKSSGHHWELYTYSGTGEFSLYMPGYAPAEIKSGHNITDGRWHYLAMTFDGQHVQLFVDGQRVNRSTVTRKNSNGKISKLWFGAYPPQKIGCDGLIDEVHISKTLRSINSVPTKPFDPDEQTIGLWRFDSFTDGRIKDESTTSNLAAIDVTKQKQAALEKLLKQAEGELQKHTMPLTYAGVRRQPKPTVLFLRGNIKTPGQQVSPGALSSIQSLSSDFKLTADSLEAHRRLKFADWVASPQNPLTARVLVNRLWQHHFGTGIVETPSDFGFNGGRPSHPKLLDWLAAEFIDSGWSIKEMHRKMMLSATYRQSSEFDPKAAESDSENRHLWRFSPHRLEGEIVRDTMLAVSGELNPQIGGPSYRPFTVTVFLTSFYHLFDSEKPEYNRRTIYRMNINTGRDPFLDSLDCPAPSIAMPSRRSTVTTSQALSMMNDSFVLRQANKFAERIRQETTGSNLSKQIPELQIQHAYRIALGRQPTQQELKNAISFVQKNSLETFCWVLLNASEFLYVR